MFDWIISIFSHTIIITIRENEWIFETVNKQFVFKPIIYLSNDKNKITGVSDLDTIIEDNSIKINLFELENIDKDIEKEILLEMFIRYAYETIHKRKSFIIPKIIIKDYSQLNKFLNGYEKFVLKEIFIKVGVYKLIFE